VVGIIEIDKLVNTNKGGEYEMKKLLYVIPVFVVFGLATTVYAANNGAGAQTGQGTQQLLYASPSPMGVQNKNQVSTQNQGEDSQLQVSTQEEENLEEGQQNMSEVAKQVQALLQVRTTGGIGQQVREIAQAQNQAQTQIQAQLDKLESKGKIARFLTGTNFEAIKSLEQQISANELRIQELTMLATQLTNQSDITMVQETIQALIQENVDLGEKVVEEMQTRSLFGWFFRLFV
jgi:DNA-binding Lrp family transcriptional regulator